MEQEKLNRFIYGVGVNDADYKVRENNRIICPYFAKWVGIIHRGFSANWKTRHPSYFDTSVCEEWLTFSNFKAWMEKQNWKGLELDKDLLIKGNKEYGPNACTFVPKYVNVFLTQVYKKNGIPIGVKYKNGKMGPRYYARSGSIHLGTFYNALDAHRAWQFAKILAFEPILARYRKDDSYSEQVEEALILRLKDIQDDYNNYRQTTLL